MAKSYVWEGKTLEPCTLDDRTLLAMGRLIRAFAELEDIATLWLGRLSGLDDAMMALFMPRAALSNKVTMAQRIAKNAEDADLLHRRAFASEEWILAAKMRNVAAHGVLIGKQEDGSLAFRTADSEDLDGGKVAFKIVSIPPDMWEHVALAAENAIPRIERALGVQKRRQENRQQAIGTRQPAQAAKPKKPALRPRPSTSQE